LFLSDGSPVFGDDISGALNRLGVDRCDVLYVHTGMQYGIPNVGLGRSAILESLAKIIYGLNVQTIIMPSYTFSFCAGEDFDRHKSPTSMGTLNEYLRSKHLWSRSCDPLMLNILHGKDDGLLNVGKSSVGKGSTFDLITNLDAKVKFLFLGPRVHECFTYMHYLESVKQVPYRYDFEFSGNIKDGEKKYKDTFKLFIRDKGVNPGAGAKIYENMLIERKVAKIEVVGGASITAVDLIEAKKIYFELLAISENFFIDEVYTRRVQSASFKPRKMVSL
jgi:aminoglycoside 3-N-acetyltransferase